MSQNSSKDCRPLCPLTEEELRAAYEKAKKDFTAADLQRYTEEEPGIPIEQVLAAMEEIQRQHEANQKEAG